MSLGTGVAGAIKCAVSVALVTGLYGWRIARVALVFTALIAWIGFYAALGLVLALILSGALWPLRLATLFAAWSYGHWPLAAAIVFAMPRLVLSVPGLIAQTLVWARYPTPRLSAPADINWSVRGIQPLR